MVESPMAGGWMASEYSSLGTRVDHELGLFHDGRFIWRAFDPRGGKTESNGQWVHSVAESVLRFSSPQPLVDGITKLWAVLAIAEMEPSGTFLLLRRVAFAGRNLPVMFYRVRPSDGLGGPTEDD